MAIHIKQESDHDILVVPNTLLSSQGCKEWLVVGAVTPLVCASDAFDNHVGWAVNP